MAYTKPCIATNWSSTNTDLFIYLCNGINVIAGKQYKKPDKDEGPLDGRKGGYKRE